MTKDIVGLNDGRNTVLVNVHTIDQCTPAQCCIHNPSEHHMIMWTPSWDDAYAIMWRRCTHGNRHPDPDDLNFWRSHDPEHARILFSHFCDGCCQPPGETGDDQKQALPAQQET